MAKPPKMAAEELAEREKRSQEFRELLEHRRALDEKLRAEREKRSPS